MADAQRDGAGLRRLSIHANFSWLFIGTALYGVAQWGYLVLLARWGSPTEVGRYALALAVCGPVFLFFEGKLREIQATDVLGSRHLGDYVAVRTATICLALVLSTAIAWFVPGIGASAAIVAAVGWTKWVESLSDILYGRMQLSERMDLIARSRIWKAVAGILTATLALRLTSSLFWMVMAVGVSWAVIMVMVDLTYVARLKGVARRRDVLQWIMANASYERSRALIRDALPLGTVSALVSLRENLPRYLLQRYFGVAEVGLYAAAMTLPEAGKRVVDPLGQALLPQLAARLHTDRAAFQRLLRVSIAIVFALALVGLIFAAIVGGPLLRLLYGEEYSGYVSVLMVGVVATGLNFIASILNVAALATRQFLIQLPAAAAAALLVLIGGAFWIPRYGALGAALALALGMAAWGATLGVALWSELRKPQRRGPSRTKATDGRLDDPIVTISLEVELAWGCRHNLSHADGIHRFSAGRVVETQRIGQLVALCDELRIPMAFDVVGHLFLRDCDGAHDGWIHGAQVPGDPAGAIDTHPLFYAPDLVERIASARVQHEICTHTYFHLNGAELTPEALRQDLIAVQRAHVEAGLPPPTSIVPPRHQDLPRHILTDLGFKVLRVPFPEYEVAYGGRPGPVRRFVDYFLEPHPIAPARMVNGLVETYCTPFASLTAPYLPVGQIKEHWGFRLIPTRLRQWYHRRYLRRAVSDAIASRSELHVWTHEFDLAHISQWENAEWFLRHIARRRDSAGLRILTMERLADQFTWPESRSQPIAVE